MIGRKDYQRLERESDRIQQRDGYNKKVFKWQVGDRVKTNLYYRLLQSRRMPFRWAVIMRFIDEHTILVRTDKDEVIEVARCWLDKVFI
jgi:hypothetical protein